MKMKCTKMQWARTKFVFCWFILISTSETVKITSFCDAEAQAESIISEADRLLISAQQAVDALTTSIPQDKNDSKSNALHISAYQTSQFNSRGACGIRMPSSLPSHLRRQTCFAMQHHGFLTRFWPRNSYSSNKWNTDVCLILSFCRESCREEPYHLNELKENNTAKQSNMEEEMWSESSSDRSSYESKNISTNKYLSTQQSYTKNTDKFPTVDSTYNAVSEDWLGVPALLERVKGVIGSMSSRSAGNNHCPLYFVPGSPKPNQSNCPKVYSLAFEAMSPRTNKIIGRLAFLFGLVDPETIYITEKMIDRYHRMKEIGKEEFALSPTPREANLKMHETCKCSNDKKDISQNEPITKIPNQYMWTTKIKQFTQPSNIHKEKAAEDLSKAAIWPTEISTPQLNSPDENANYILNKNSKSTAEEYAKTVKFENLQNINSKATKRQLTSVSEQNLEGHATGQPSPGVWLINGKDCLHIFDFINEKESLAWLSHYLYFLSE